MKVIFKNINFESEDDIYCWSCEKDVNAWKTSSDTFLSSDGTYKILHLYKCPRCIFLLMVLKIKVQKKLIMFLNLLNNFLFLSIQMQLKSLKK